MIPYLEGLFTNPTSLDVPMMYISVLTLSRYSHISLWNIMKWGIPQDFAAKLEEEVQGGAATKPPRVLGSSCEKPCVCSTLGDTFPKTSSSTSTTKTTASSSSSSSIIIIIIIIIISISRRLLQPGWLADEGLRNEDLEIILQAARDQESQESCLELRTGLQICNQLNRLRFRSMLNQRSRTTPAPAYIGLLPKFVDYNFHRFDCISSLYSLYSSLFGVICFRWILCNRTCCSQCYSTHSNHSRMVFVYGIGLGMFVSHDGSWLVVWNIFYFPIYWE